MQDRFSTQECSVIMSRYSNLDTPPHALPRPVSRPHSAPSIISRQNLSTCDGPSNHVGPFSISMAWRARSRQEGGSSEEGSLGHPAMRAKLLPQPWPHHEQIECCLAAPRPALSLSRRPTHSSHFLHRALSMSRLGHSHSSIYRHCQPLYHPPA